MMVAKWCLSSYIIPSTLILWLYCEEELPFTSPHLPVYTNTESWISYLLEEQDVLRFLQTFPDPHS